jgi:hypothetical protein
VPKSWEYVCEARSVTEFLDALQKLWVTLLGKVPASGLTMPVGARTGDDYRIRP